MFEPKLYDDGDDDGEDDYDDADGQHKSWVWHNLCESQCDSTELTMKGKYVVVFLSTITK